MRSQLFVNNKFKQTYSYDKVQNKDKKSRKQISIKNLQNSLLLSNYL